MHDALREALANCLTNADYNERRGVVFLWKEDGLHFSNPGGFRVGLEDAYIGGNSDPRNETMMKTMAEALLTATSPDSPTTLPTTPISTNW